MVLSLLTVDMTLSPTAATCFESHANRVYVPHSRHVKHVSQMHKSSTDIGQKCNAAAAGLQTELSAVLEYSEKLVDECVAKPETYEEPNPASRRVCLGGHPPKYIK
eukprot:4326009-Amphidinium_carterae.1